MEAPWGTLLRKGFAAKTTPLGRPQGAQSKATPPPQLRTDAPEFSNIQAPLARAGGVVQAENRGALRRAVRFPSFPEQLGLQAQAGCGRSANSEFSVYIGLQ